MCVCRGKISERSTWFSDFREYDQRCRAAENWPAANNNSGEIGEEEVGVSRSYGALVVGRSLEFFPDHFAENLDIDRLG